MNVYVESNYVLELALEQEQFAACETLLATAERRAVGLVVPAFALAEPFETLGRHRSQRAQLKTRLESEVRLLRRTDAYRQRAMAVEDLSILLAASAQQER